MAMITIRLNDTTCTFEKGCFLADILLREGYTDSYFAVAVNQQFIPRTAYLETRLNDGDSIEVVSPMQGG